MCAAHGVRSTSRVVEVMAKARKTVINGGGHRPERERSQQQQQRDPSCLGYSKRLARSYYYEQTVCVRETKRERETRGGQVRRTVSVWWEKRARERGSKIGKGNNRSGGENSVVASARLRKRIAAHNSVRRPAIRFVFNASNSLKRRFSCKF